jgi:predicted transposase/invertase (TIGR01784 family)
VFEKYIYKEDDKVKKTKNDKVSNPHDKFFKETMKDPQTAGDFLRLYLPKELAEKLNLNKLELQKDSFIDSKLKVLQTDLLFKTEYLGTTTFIYVLFEHKSYPDKKTGIQLMKYLMSIWEKNLDEKTIIPVILPIVIYHGKKSWPWAGNLKYLWPENSEKYMIPYLPDFNYEIYDFSTDINETAQKNPKISVFLNTLKINYLTNTEEKTAIIREILYTISTSQDKIENGYIETILFYIMTIENELTENSLTEIAKDISFRGDDIIMTIAERLRKEGFEKGIQQGVQQGLQQGVEKTIINMLKFGFSEKDIAKATGITLDRIQELKKENNIE